MITRMWENKMNISGIRWTSDFYKQEREFQNNKRENDDSNKLTFDEILDVEIKKWKENNNDNH